MRGSITSQGPAAGSTPSTVSQVPGHLAAASTVSVAGCHREAKVTPGVRVSASIPCDSMPASYSELDSVIRRFLLSFKHDDWGPEFLRVRVGKVTQSLPLQVRGRCGG